MCFCDFTWISVLLAEKEQIKLSNCKEKILKDWKLLKLKGIFYVKRTYREEEGRWVRLTNFNLVYLQCSDISDFLVVGKFMSYWLLLPGTTFITECDSISHLLSDNKWHTDKITFLCLFSLINMFWLAEQSPRTRPTAYQGQVTEWLFPV